jgi:hypothetical protein
MSLNDNCGIVSRRVDCRVAARVLNNRGSSIYPPFPAGSVTPGVPLDNLLILQSVSTGVSAIQSIFSTQQYSYESAHSPSREKGQHCPDSF